MSGLSPQQAAELLNVSEPYLVGLIESGALPFHEVDGERRVRLDDLLAYKRARDATRADALREMADEAQRLGLGYSTLPRDEWDRAFGSVSIGGDALADSEGYYDAP